MSKLSRQIGRKLLGHEHHNVRSPSLVIARYRITQSLHSLSKDGAHTLHTYTILELEQMFDLLATLVHREDEERLGLEHPVILAVITHNLGLEICISSRPDGDLVTGFVGRPLLLDLNVHRGQHGLEPVVALDQRVTDYRNPILPREAGGVGGHGYIEGICRDCGYAIAMHRRKGVQISFGSFEQDV